MLSGPKWTPDTATFRAPLMASHLKSNSFGGPPIGGMLYHH